MLSQPNKQSGFALVLSLILLIILTMLGLTSMHSTKTEIAMAGNMRESDLAFQSAEIGLISSEEFIELSTSKTDYNDLNGLISENSDDPDYYDDDSWNNVKNSSATLNSVYANPKYIIKYLGDRSQNEVAAVNIGGYGSEQPGFTVSYFRATSRGYGQTERATRMIQSYYGKEF